MKRQSLGEFAKQKNVDTIYGSNMKCSVKEFDKIVMPEDREELIELMKKKGVWDDFASINLMKFQSGVVKGNVDDDVRKLVEIVKAWRVSVSRKKGGGEGEV